MRIMSYCRGETKKDINKVDHVDIITLPQKKPLKDKENDHVSSSSNTLWSPNQNLAHQSELSYVYNLSPSPKRLSKSIVRVSSHETLKRARDGVDSKGTCTCSDVMDLSQSSLDYYGDSHKKQLMVMDSEDGEREIGRRSKRKRKHSPSIDSFSDGCNSEGTPMKTTAMDIAVASSVSCNWQHLSIEATTLFNSSLQHCKTVPFSMTKVQKRLIEREFEQVLSQVETELVSATAPKITSKVSYSRLKQEVCNLKVKCLSLIQQNNDLLKQLVERKNHIEERNTKTKQLCDSQLQNDHGGTTDLLQCIQTPPNCLMNSKESFEDHLVDLLDASPNIS